jgi:hypothetical protein
LALAFLLTAPLSSPANERGIFSYSITLGEAGEEGSDTRRLFTSLAGDGVTPLFEEKEEEYSPGDLVFSGELSPVTPGQARYQTAFVEIAAGIGIVEHGVLDVTVDNWPDDDAFPDFLRIDQPGDFTAQGTWTPTLTSAPTQEVRLVFERAAGDREGSYRIDFLARTSGGIAVLGDPAHHYVAPEAPGSASSWEDQVGNHDFSLSSAVDAVAVTSGFGAVPNAYQLVAPFGSSDGGEADSFDSTFNGATGAVEIWFQADYGSIPTGEKQVIFETGGNDTGLGLLVEQAAGGDPLLRLLQSEGGSRNLDVTLNLAGEGGFAGLTMAARDDFIQCVLSFDSAAEELTILVNGQTAKTVSTTGITSLCGGNDAALFNTSGDVESHLGGRGGDAGYDGQIAQFTGKIANLRVYPTPLTAQDALANFEAMRNPGVARSLSGSFTLPRITADGASTTTAGNTGDLALEGDLEDGGGLASLTGSADYTRNGSIILSALQLNRAGGGQSLAEQNVLLSVVDGSYQTAFSVDDGNQATSWADYRHFFLQLPADAPVITEGPTATEVPAGEPLELRVEVSGLFISYQWLHDGAEIVGADGPAFQVPHSGSNHAGQYFVRLNTQTGQLDSPVVLTNILPPKITCAISPSDTMQDTYVLSWNSYPGQTYQVRQTVRFDGWTDLGDSIPGTGEMLEQSISTTSFTHRYFHIQTTY